MKNKRKPTKKLDLDHELIADLEASSEETEAVKGGGITPYCGGSIHK